MNDDTIQDLKQFITTTLSQQLTGVENRLGARIEKIETRMDGFETRMDDLDAKMDTILDTVGGQLVGHEERITKLEQSPA